MGKCVLWLVGCTQVDEVWDLRRAENPAMERVPSVGHQFRSRKRSILDDHEPGAGDRWMPGTDEVSRGPHPIGRGTCHNNRHVPRGQRFPTRKFQGAAGSIWIKKPSYGRDAGAAMRTEHGKVRATHYGANSVALIHR
jgi:hypothetical protein